MADDIRKIRADRPVKQGGISIGAGGTVQFSGGLTDSPEKLAAFNSVVDTRFNETNYYWGTNSEAPPEPPPDGLQAVTGLTGQLQDDGIIVMNMNWEVNIPEPDGYFLTTYTDPGYTTMYGDDWYPGDYSSATPSEGFEPYTPYYLKIVPYNTVSGDYLDIDEPGTEFGDEATTPVALFMRAITGFILTATSEVEPDLEITANYDYPTTWPEGLVLLLEWGITSDFSGTLSSQEIESGTYSFATLTYDGVPIEPFVTYYFRIKAVLGAESSAYSYDDILLAS